jgi:hypothetical protein
MTIQGVSLLARRAAGAPPPKALSSWPASPPTSPLRQIYEPQFPSSVDPAIASPSPSQAKPPKLSWRGKASRCCARRAWRLANRVSLHLFNACQSSTCLLTYMFSLANDECLDNSRYYCSVSICMGALQA